MKQPELTAEEYAAHLTMQGFHDFAVSALTIYDEDHPIAILARRLAQRMRYRLIVGENPNEAEVRDRVIANLAARRERLAALIAK